MGRSKLQTMEQYAAVKIGIYKVCRNMELHLSYYYAK